jgi:hypothetical protein
MCAPVSEFDIEQYGYKMEDVKKINLYITCFSLLVFGLFTFILTFFI